MNKVIKKLVYLFVLAILVSVVAPKYTVKAQEPNYTVYNTLKAETGKEASDIKRKVTSYGWGWIEADSHANDLPEGAKIEITYDGKDSPLKGTTKQDVYAQPTFKFDQAGQYELKFQITYPESADLSEKTTIYLKYVVNVEKSKVEVVYMDGDKKLELQGYDKYQTLANTPKLGDKDGKHFAGWYTEKDGKGIRMADGSALGDQDVTLYAYYTDEIAVTFMPGTLGYVSDSAEANHGVIKKVQSGSKVDEVPSVKLYDPENYTFAGWAVLGTEEIVDPANMTFDAPKTFVAKYKAKDGSNADPRDPAKEKDIDYFFEYQLGKTYAEGSENEVASYEVSTSKPLQSYSVTPNESNGIKSEVAESQKDGRYVYKFTFPATATKVGYNFFTINYTEKSGLKETVKVGIYVIPNYKIHLFYEDGKYEGVKVTEDLKANNSEAEVAKPDRTVILTERNKKQTAKEVLNSFKPTPAVGYFFVGWLASNKEKFETLNDFNPNYTESLTANYKLMPLQVELKKVDSKNEQLVLKDAKFDLYRVKEDGSKVLVRSDLVSDEKGHVYGGGLTAPENFKTNGELKKVVLAENTVFDKEKGYYQNGEDIYLTQGNYVLVEKQAPKGYKLGDDFKFELVAKEGADEDSNSVSSQSFLIKNNQLTNAETYVPEPAVITVEAGTPPKSDDGVGNFDKLPGGTKTEFKTGTPEMTKPGTYPVTIVITYPDGSTEEIETKVVVNEKKNNNNNNNNNNNVVPNTNNNTNTNNNNKNNLPNAGTTNTLPQTAILLVSGISLITLSLKKKKD